METLVETLVETQDFLNELARLEREHQTSRLNPGSYACSGCEKCTSCMFSTGCTGCYRCTHCADCEGCTHSSHSAACVACHGCAYCINSSDCTGGAYLVRCSACADCTYCFGCVGLVKREFCILNVPYSRQDYFDLVKQLSAELTIRRTP